MARKKKASSASEAVGRRWIPGDRVRVIRGLKTTRPIMLGATGTVTEIADALGLMLQQPEFRAVRVQLDDGQRLYFGSGELGNESEQVAW